MDDTALDLDALEKHLFCDGHNDGAGFKPGHPCNTRVSEHHSEIITAAPALIAELRKARADVERLKMCAHDLAWGTNGRTTILEKALTQAEAERDALRGELHAHRMNSNLSAAFHVPSCAYQDEIDKRLDAEAERDALRAKVQRVRDELRHNHDKFVDYCDRCRALAALEGAERVRHDGDVGASASTNDEVKHG